MTPMRPCRYAPSLCVINGPHFSDDGHLDLPRILQLRLDLPGDVFREPDRLLVADLFRIDDDAQLAPRLDGEALGDAFHGVRDPFEPLQAVHVVLENLAARA